MQDDNIWRIASLEEKVLELEEQRDMAKSIKRITRDLSLILLGAAIGSIIVNLLFHF